LTVSIKELAHANGPYTRILQYTVPIQLKEHNKDFTIQGKETLATRLHMYLDS